MREHFKTSCDKTNLKQIRTFVSGFLSQAGLPEKETHLMVLAVDEICANLIIHSNACNPDENIEVQAKTDNGKVYFEISDKGNAFDPKQYKEPDLQEAVHNRLKGGVGLMMVKRIMDEVMFCKETDKNVCRMHKSVQSQEIETAK